MNKTQKITAQIILVSFIIIGFAIADFGFGIADRYFTSGEKSPTSTSEQVNSLPVLTNQMVVPDQPYGVAITPQKNFNSAMNEIIDRVGEATLQKCQWSEEKLQAGGYDSFAKMHIWKYNGIAYGQTVVDKSVCPDVVK